jgi:hypothetical protein
MTCKSSVRRIIGDENITKVFPVPTSGGSANVDVALTGPFEKN